MRREERWKRIKDLRFRWYKRAKGKGISGYLKKGWAEDRWRRIVRYKLGEGVKKGIYWERKRGHVGCVGEKRKHGVACDTCVGEL